MLVIFKECSDTQAKWGGGFDPREYLTIGLQYKVNKSDEHTYHTRYYIDGMPNGVWFNSVCFEEVVAPSRMVRLGDYASFM